MALSLQLDACLQHEELDAILLADDIGMCLASSGSRDVCEEIAAQLPLIGRRTPEFRGVLFGPGQKVSIHVKRFEAAGESLYACAIGTASDRRASELDRSIAGAERILS